MKTQPRHPTRFSVGLSTVAVSTALLLAACGGGPGATGPAGPAGTSGPGGPSTQAPGGATQAPGGATIDACALLTEADIEEVTGNTVDAVTPGPQMGIFQSGCDWDLIDDDAMVPPEIVIGVHPSGGRDYYARYFEPFNEGAGYEPIENLGDTAVDAEAGAVLVVAGDVFFNLQYIGLTQDDTEIAAELARKVVANLSR
jgi:hypothetical protein